MLSVTLRQAGPIALDAQLSCAAGELLALVGPSGAGKSTILRAIAGLSRVKQAQVSVGGNCWQDSGSGHWLEARDRRVGMVFQGYGLFPHLSVLDNVAEAVFQLPRAERQARAAAALARVRLAGLEARLPHQLSGGQQQRVALARALVREPEVLLLDEPFAAVDQMTRERLYEELAELRSSLKVPVVLVTHSLIEAQLLADRMVVLRHGKTLQQGTPTAVLSRPDTEEVARLVGFGNVFETEVLAIEPLPDADENALQQQTVWVAAAAAGAGSMPGRLGLDLPDSLFGVVQPGQRLRWGISLGDVVVLKGGRAPDDARQCAEVQLEKAVALGESVRLTFAMGGLKLRAAVTARFFERSGMAEGQWLKVELPRSKLVVFKSQGDQGTDDRG